VFYVGHVDKCSLYETLFHCNVLSKHHHQPATAIENKRGVIQDRKVFSPRGGSIFFAVTGRGAYARPLAMPLGGAYEVQVSDCKEASNSILCESAEATHGYVYLHLHVYVVTCV
jgi:hypothetical protein